MDRSISRHEIKYVIRVLDAELLKRRLPALLRRDPHAGPDGGYFIRSVYFDDLNFTAYNEKVAGVKERTKYRLRYYNFDDRALFLEKKKKDGDLTGKDSVPVTREGAEALLAGSDLTWARDGGLLEEFARLRQGAHRPAVVVDYDRYAFTYPAEDVRVTLDMDVRTSPYQTGFFNARLLTLPVLEPGEAVLEVKYNAFLPAPVGALLEGVPKRRESVSKFVKCLSILE